MPDLKKTDANPPEIEHENHLESSSQIKTGAAERNLEAKMEVKNLPEIKDEHQQVWFFLHLTPFFLTTVSSFIVAYRKGNDYLIPALRLGWLNVVLIDYFLTRYRSMPEKKLWIKLTIWFLYTALVLILIIPCSYLWRWSFQSIVVADLVVLALSLVLLDAWIIGGIVNYRKIWRSGKDEIDVPENPTIVAGK